jgi:hypothetical protein
MDSLVHILHLEDDPVDVELVRAMIEERDLAHRITRASGRRDARWML